MTAATENDQLLNTLTDSLRIMLVSLVNGEPCEDAFNQAQDFLQEHIVRVESDIDLNMLMFKLKDRSVVDVHLTREEAL
jgi:Mg/Co/Ni transporter MgtE